MDETLGIHTSIIRLWQLCGSIIGVVWAATLNDDDMIGNLLAVEGAIGIT